jgi:hypothetical protein
VSGDKIFTVSQNYVPSLFTVEFLPGEHGTFALESYTSMFKGEPTPEPSAATGESGWTFAGWSPAFSETINGSVSYTAQWSSAPAPVITITAGSSSKKYDGSALTDSRYFLSALPFGTTHVVAETTGAQKDRGTGTNEITSFAVYNGASDVTENYSVQLVPGTLEVTPRELILTSANDKKSYDGTPLENHTVTASGDGFADGEGAIYDVFGSVTDPGSEENVFAYGPLPGTDLENYDIRAIFGTLTVREAIPDSNDGDNTDRDNNNDSWGDRDRDDDKHYGVIIQTPSHSNPIHPDDEQPPDNPLPMTGGVETSKIIRGSILAVIAMMIGLLRIKPR